MRKTALFLLFACLGAGCAHNEKPINYTRNFSYGFEDEGRVYFLLEYRVWRKRAPLWFIMPIERPPEVFFSGCYLYRFEPESGGLERLATVRENPARMSLQSSKFTKDGDGIVFAYQAGISLERGVLYALRIWDTRGEELRELGPDALGPKDSELHRRYFEDYVSPWSDNPGIIGISALKAMVADVEDDLWQLPRDW